MIVAVSDRLCKRCFRPTVGEYRTGGYRDFCTTACYNKFTRTIPGVPRQAVAAAFGLNARQILTLIERGLPCIRRPDGHDRFDLDAANAWWAANSVRWLTKGGSIREICEADPQACDRPGLIYAMIDTATKATIYIGKAVDLKERWRLHQRALAIGEHGNWRLQKWYDEVGRDPARLDIQIIELCSGETINHRERFWINHGRTTDWPLLNISDGGEGLNRSHEPSVRKKLSAISRKKWKDPEYVARWKRAMVPVYEARRKAIA